MSKDDREKQGSVEQQSKATVEGSRERERTLNKMTTCGSHLKRVCS